LLLLFLGRPRGRPGADKYSDKMVGDAKKDWRPLSVIDFLL
jgi:hypothetical protein